MKHLPVRARVLSLLTVVSTIVLWACGEESNPVGNEDPDDPQPMVALSQSSVSLSAMEGESSPVTSTVSVTNGGDGSLTGISVSVSGGSAWLSATLSQSSAPATLTVSASAEALSAGTHTGSVEVSSSTAGNGPQMVQVTFTVTEAPSGPLPDLVVDGGVTLLPATVQPADEFFLGQIVVENLGEAAASGFDFGVYLSADADVTTDDTRLDGDTHPSLAAGETESWAKRPLSLPVGTAPGSYHVGVVLDENGSVPESDETNNVVTAELTVTDPTADPAIGLSPAEITFTAAEGGSNPLEQSVSIVNDGGGSVTGLTSNVSYATGQPTGWLSASLSTPSAPSTLALDVSIASLSPGTYEATVEIASPDAVNSPQAVDVTLTVSEAMPDLIVQGLDVSPTTVVAGGSVSGGGYQIRNVGGTGAGGIENGFYLSVDTTLTPSDLRLTGNANSFIDAGDSFTWGGPNLTVPASTPPGTYYIGVLTDEAGTVDESDESNNFQSVEITVTAPPSIGLSPTSVGFAAEEGGSDPGPKTVQIVNDGGGSLIGLGVSVAYDGGQPTGWLTATLNQTTAPAEMALVASVGSLTEGTYGATVTVSSGVADDSPRAVDVSFVVSAGTSTTFTLTLDQNIADAGEVTADPVGPTYEAGTEVTLTAVATTGFRFASWSGDAGGLSGQTTVTMSADRSVTANFELEPPTLEASAVSDGSFTLTWEFGWPCPDFCLGSSQDRYELEESTTSPTSGFSVVATMYGRTSPQSTELTRDPGTYYYRVRVIDDANYGTSPYSAVRTVVVDQTQTSATTIRVINDLPGGVYGPNDWTKLNTIIRVRVGSSQDAVLYQTGDWQELLYPYDQTSSVANLIDIQPGDEMTLEVPAYETEYWLFIQTGWWDYFVETGLWEKHMAVVLNCNQDTTYKWTTIRVTQPFGHPEVIRASDFLPDGHWYGSGYC